MAKPGIMKNTSAALTSNQAIEPVSYVPARCGVTVGAAAELAAVDSLMVGVAPPIGVSGAVASDLAPESAASDPSWAQVVPAIKRHSTIRPADRPVGRASRDFTTICLTGRTLKNDHSRADSPRIRAHPPCGLPARQSLCQHGCQ